MKSKMGKDNKNTKGKKTTTTKSKKEKIYKVNLEKPNNVKILKNWKTNWQYGYQMVVTREGRRVLTNKYPTKSPFNSVNMIVYCDIIV